MQHNTKIIRSKIIPSCIDIRLLFSALEGCKFASVAAFLRASKDLLRCSKDFLRLMVDGGAFLVMVDGGAFLVMVDVPEVPKGFVA